MYKGKNVFLLFYYVMETNYIAILSIKGIKMNIDDQFCDSFAEKKTETSSK